MLWKLLWFVHTWEIINIDVKMKKISHLFRPLTLSCWRSLSYRNCENQWTGFYMIGTFVKKELKQVFIFNFLSWKRMSMVSRCTRWVGTLTNMSRKVSSSRDESKSSGGRQKDETQNGGNRKTRHAKFSEKRTFFTSWYAQVRMRITEWVMFVFRKICCALFSCYLSFEIHPFALLPMKWCFCEHLSLEWPIRFSIPTLILASLISSMTTTFRKFCHCL